MADRKTMEPVDDAALKNVSGGGRLLQFDTRGVNRYSWFVSLMMGLFPGRQNNTAGGDTIQPPQAAEEPVNPGRR